MCHFVLVFLVLLVLRLPRLGKRELILVLFVRLFNFCLFGLSVSSSSWGLGRAAVCDCGTPWTFLLLLFWNCRLQLTLVISTSLISNRCLSRSENLARVLTWKSNSSNQNIIEKGLMPLLHCESELSVYLRDPTFLCRVFKRTDGWRRMSGRWTKIDQYSWLNQMLKWSETQ